MSYGAWLKQRKSTEQRWHRRYVAVCGLSVQIYKDEGMKLKEMDLNFTPETKIITSSSSQPTFEVVIPDRPKLIFQANTLNQRDDWINLLRATTVSSKITMEDLDIMAVIGRGYFGKVMLVKHRLTGMKYALKTVRKELLNDDKVIENIFSERNILMKIKHPFIVRLHFSFQTESKIYFGLEYASGGELFYHEQPAEVLDFDDARLYIAEITLALEYLHGMGIIYRDLKPENILFDEDGHIKLTDFGLAKQLHSEGGSCSTFCGTCNYLAPEVILKKDYSYEIDIWALGVIAYEMMFGATPFYDDNQKEMMKNILTIIPEYDEDIDPRISNFLNKLMEKDPRKRATIAEIKSDPFFEGFVWDYVYDKRYAPHYIPSHNMFENFDQEFLLEKCVDSYVKPTEGELANIEGFSFFEDSHLLV